MKLRPNCGDVLRHVRGGNPQAVVGNMYRAAHQQPHGAVEPGAGIPPRRRLAAAVHHYGYAILFAKPQIWRKIHAEGGIGVLVRGGEMAVDADQAGLLHPFKFQVHRLAGVVRRNREGFEIGVVVARIVGTGCAGRVVRRPLLGNHGVVGQRHRVQGVFSLIVQLFVPGVLFIEPAIVEALSNHVILHL